MMDDKTYIFTFSFRPQKLSQARQDIENKYGDIDKLTASQLSAVRLPKLLELIRQTPEDEIEQLAHTLKKRDVMVLVYEYPFNQESYSVQKKINLVLYHHYSPSIGSMIWGGFQGEYNNVYIQDLLRRFYSKDGTSFLYSEYEEEKLTKQLMPVFMNKNGIAQGLAELMANEKMKSIEFMRMVKIKPESELEDYLVFQTLQRSLHQDGIISRDGETFVIQMLEKYPMQSYQELMKIYLEARNHEQFHARIMEQAIRRLHDPRDRDEDWAFLSEEGREEVNRWLIVARLKTINDEYRRFEFWKRYLLDIQDVSQLDGENDPAVLFIYFKKFVVVEFGEIGAAYFYHKKGFNKFILSRITGTEFRRKGKAAKEKALKDTEKIKRGEPLYITSLGHYGAFETWTEKFRKHISEFMYGHYDYSE